MALGHPRCGVRQLGSDHWGAGGRVRRGERGLRRRRFGRWQRHLQNCRAANCDTQIFACYGTNHGTDDATGSLCESLWTCSKTCTCGDDSCLVNTRFSAAGSGCQACIPAVTTCMQTHCQAEANQC